MEALQLNLGACDRRVDGYISVDIVEPADQLVDLAGPWPWSDSSVRSVLAYDVFEHIPDCSHVNPNYVCRECSWMRARFRELMERIGYCSPFATPVRDQFGKRHVMNELWRVLEPGGRAQIQVPHATDGDGGHCDPTHRTYWTPSDFEYYIPGYPERERFRDSDYYGVKADFVITNLVNGKIRTVKHPRRLGGHVVELVVELEAVKFE